MTAKSYVITALANRPDDPNSTPKTTYAYDQDGYITAEPVEYISAEVATSKYSFNYKEF